MIKYTRDNTFVIDAVAVLEQLPPSSDTRLIWGPHSPDSEVHLQVQVIHKSKHLVAGSLVSFLACTKAQGTRPSCRDCRLPLIFLFMHGTEASLDGSNTSDCPSKLPMDIELLRRASRRCAFDFPKTVTIGRFDERCCALVVEVVMYFQGNCKAA